jgi:hypothetical protein
MAAASLGSWTGQALPSRADETPPLLRLTMSDGASIALDGARDEFLLAATAQNLRKLAKLIPAPAPLAPA